MYDKIHYKLKKKKKSRDITLPTKVCLVKAMVFPVVMYGCERWTVKKAEHQRIGAFELWCWRRLLRVPWTARRSNQSILKKSVLGVHWKDWCWSWNSNTLATSWEELTPWQRPWCWEGLAAEGEGDDKGWDSITDLMDMGLSELREFVMNREAWHAVIHGVTKSWTQLSDWIELTVYKMLNHFWLPSISLFCIDQHCHNSTPVDFFFQFQLWM